MIPPVDYGCITPYAMEQHAFRQKQQRVAIGVGQDSLRTFGRLGSEKR